MIITYKRCICCGANLGDRLKLFCDICSRVEKDGEEQELFEKHYHIKIDDLRDWEKRKAFLRKWDDFDLRARGTLEEWDKNPDKFLLGMFPGLIKRDVVR